MAKKLEIEAAVCDLRGMQEETLAAYPGGIRVEAAVLITSPAARSLLARYPFTLKCAQTIELDDETKLNTLNGKTVLTGRNTPNGRQYLMVNGIMTVTPDAGDALRQYMGMTINGKVYCPDSLITTLTGMATINGKVYSYPDGAALLKNNAVLDRAFALRAEGRTYWAPGRLIAVDDSIDAEALARKGVRFSVQEAYLTESGADALAPLFDADTRLVILPDGVSVVQDDLTLNAAGLRRYGESLVVLGDLCLAEDCAGALAGLDYLQVEGNVYLPESLSEAIDAIPETFFDGEVHYLPGSPLYGRPKMTVDRALLDAFPDGLSLVNCLGVTISPALSAADILEKLTLFSCTSVRCPAALLGAVQSVSTDAVEVTADDAASAAGGAAADTQRIEAVIYPL